MMASLSMISPPLYGCLKRVFPYCTLSNLDFLQVQGFLAGVSNPMFKQRLNWFDICCDVETGQVIANEHILNQYKAEQFFNTDKEFINYLLARIRNKEISEEDIRSMFNEYTKIIVDLSLGDYDLLFDNSPSQSMAESQMNRVNSFKTTKGFETMLSLRLLKEKCITNGKSLKLVETCLRKLEYRTSIESNELNSILGDINSYMKNDSCINQVLAMLPKFRQGINLLAIPLLSKNQEVARKSRDILTKIKKSKVSNSIFYTLNPFLLMAFEDTKELNDKM